MSSADADAVRVVLETGEIEVEGRMPWSSNATFLVQAAHDDRTERGIYKPHRGERPLWDFPSGLFQREVAAYELASALGWDVVPITVARDDDAPLGEGSLQHFVDADFEQHYFTLFEDEAFHDQLRRICAFDLIANTIGEFFPDAICTPYIMMAATDSRHFTKICERVYRFAPFRMSKAQREAIHSFDERIGVEDFLVGIRWYQSFIERLPR